MTDLRLIVEWVILDIGFVLKLREKEICFLFYFIGVFCFGKNFY